MARVGVALLDVAAPVTSFDFSTADEWYVVVLLDGEPVAVVETPSPGAVDSGALAEALFTRAADGARRRREFLSRLSRRMGAVELAPDPVAVSVVVCTYRRPPAQLRRFLDSAAALDPAPAQVVVVDNDPGGEGCAGLVGSYGFGYVREDRRGLDNARNAGLAAASGDVVAFTDDDVVLPPSWLASVPASFADPSVGAATGPAFPWSLESPAQIRMERQASLGRGLGRRTVDWTSLSPVRAGAIGAGANMIVRRSLLGRRPFPPELDAGTPSGSGGDTYLLARILAAGHRIVYEPRQYVFHDHRRDAEGMRSALIGYGKGVTAVCLRLFGEGEMEAPAAWLWVLRQYLGTLRRRMSFSADAAELRTASLYLLGGMLGFLGYARARRGTDTRVDPIPPLGAEAPVAASPAPRVSGSVSVIVPTVDRPDVLRRCLAALASQTGLEDVEMEVIVVDDAPVPSARADGVRILRTGGAGAATARNRGAEAAAGDLLLFLDDDLVPAPTAVARHLAEHAGRQGAIVMGQVAPSPRYERSSFLSAGAAALWWTGHLRQLRASRRLTFIEALSGNMSIRREDFRRLGGFDGTFGRHRREDWEYGLRALEAGLELRYVHEAVAVHEFALSGTARLRLNRSEARGDALLLERFPYAVASLPAGLWHGTGLRRSPWLVRFAAAVLPALEWLRFRTTWADLHFRGQRVAYLLGLQESGVELRPERAPRLRVDVADDDPLPEPGPVAPVIELFAGGIPVAVSPVPEGHWTAAMWERVADRFRGAEWRSIGAVLDDDEPRDVRLDGLSVVLAAGSDAPAFAAAGAHIVESGDEVATPLVAYVSDVRVTPAHVARLLVAFDGPRVGAILGRLRAGGSAAGPLRLNRDVRAIVGGWGAAEIVVARAEVAAAAPAPSPATIARTAEAAGRLVATREVGVPTSSGSGGWPPRDASSA